MSKLLPEFPTEWHQQAYVAGLTSEIAGYKNRMGELETLGLGKGDPAWNDAHAGHEAATAELVRVTGATKEKPAAKKPATARKAAAKK
jgi:hypothetical protein